MKNDITRFDMGIFNSVSFTNGNTKEYSETTSDAVIKELIVPFFMLWSVE